MESIWIELIILPSSAVLMMTGELLGPSPGLVKQSTVMWYSVNFWTPSTRAVCSASGSKGLGGTVTVFSKEAFTPENVNSIMNYQLLGFIKAFFKELVLFLILKNWILWDSCPNLWDFLGFFIHF